VLWTNGILLIGYFLARKITDWIPPEKVDAYLFPLILLIVLISATPIFIEIFRGWRAKRSGAAPESDDASEAGRHRAVS
jgi:membrane-associated protein